MRILRVRLANLNSLRGSHEVNFDAQPLAGAGLFAITGPTGAGKSTVLDAITLALYGKAARYGTMPSPEDMMSRHSGECSASVTFEVPSGTYRAEWSLRRARGRPDGNMQPPRRFLYDIHGAALAQNVREAEAWIERLVGLDYARFLRSAMLAQGEFAQFLKARPDERAALLESLTGTSVYSELGALAYGEVSRREQEVAARAATIERVQLLPEQDRERLLEEIPRAVHAFEVAKAELEGVRTVLNRAANLAVALEQERTILAAQRALALEREQAAVHVQRLAQHRLAAPFLEDLARLEAAGQAAQDASDKVVGTQLELTRVRRDAARCWLGLRRWVDDRTAAAEGDLHQASAASRRAAERTTAANAWLAANRRDRALPVALPDLLVPIEQLKAARRDLVREWDQVCQLAGQLGPSHPEPPTSTVGLSPDDFGRWLVRLREAAESARTESAASLEAARVELKLREDHLAQARRVADFETHRATLVPGEPCPLCGATTHPFAEGSPPAFPFRALEQRVTEAKHAWQERARNEETYGKLVKDLARCEMSLRAAAVNHTAVLNRATVALGPFDLEPPPAGEEDIVAGKLQQRAKAVTMHVTETDAAARDLQHAEASVARLEDVLNHLHAKQAALATDPEPWLSTGSGESAGEGVPAWTSFEQGERAWNASRHALVSIMATLKERTETKARLDAALAEGHQALIGRLVGSPFADLAALQSARMEPHLVTTLEAAENRLRHREMQMAAERAAVQDGIEHARRDSVPEGDAVAAWKRRHTELQAGHDQLIADLATWRNRLEHDNRERRRVAEERASLEMDQRRLMVWLQLRGLIGSFDGRIFRRYAQGISLDVLVHYANRHLVRLSDRYRMRRRPGEDLELEIADLHQAGAVRPMASLSGGESFLASLALALGLSDIAGRNVRIESLFIDEGFGALDAETLDLAISALETLRQDQKTVGVISHVDLLKERITTQIVVEKQAGGTSVLRVVGG